MRAHPSTEVVPVELTAREIQLLEDYAQGDGTDLPTFLRGLALDLLASDGLLDEDGEDEDSPCQPDRLAGDW